MVAVVVWPIGGDGGCRDFVDSTDSRIRTDDFGRLPEGEDFDP